MKNDDIGALAKSHAVGHDDIFEPVSKEVAMLDVLLASRGIDVSTVPEDLFDTRVGWIKRIFDRAKAYQERDSAISAQASSNATIIRSRSERLRDAMATIVQIELAQNQLAVAKECTRLKMSLTAYEQYIVEYTLRNLDSELRIRENRDRAETAVWEKVQSVLIQSEADRRKELHELELKKIDAEMRIYVGNIILKQLYEYQELNLKQLIEADNKILEAEAAGNARERARWIQHRDTLQLQFAEREKILLEKKADYTKATP